MNQEELIRKASELIAIASTADNKPALHEAVDFIANILKSNPNITIERFESNGVPSFLAYFSKTRPATFDILLNAHVDVVPGKPEQFQAKLVGNKLYGRGMYDMKMAAIIMADVFMREAQTSPRTIGLQITSDEENSGNDCVVHQLAQGVRTDFAITGEMTNLEICNETRGICWAEITFEGQSAHGGYAWDGDNAITRASHFAQKLLAKFPVPAKRQWCTTANIASIATNNSTFNIVPGNATLKVDFRFTPEDKNFKDERSLRALIASIDPTAEVASIATFGQAVYVSLNHPTLQAFATAFKKVNHKSPKYIRRYGSSDSRHFAGYNIPCIEFGLSGDNLHAELEYIDLSSLKPYQATLETFLRTPIAQKQVLQHTGLVSNARR